MTCTRCEGTGFINLHQVDDETLKKFDETGNAAIIKEWTREHDENDVLVCDCCGDGENWHGVRGEHYNLFDPRGSDGPYAYNGGLCECH